MPGNRRGAGTGRSLSPCFTRSMEFVVSSYKLDPGVAHSVTEIARDKFELTTCTKYDADIFLDLLQCIRWKLEGHYRICKRFTEYHSDWYQTSCGGDQ
jgi:hypothetical protein